MSHPRLVEHTAALCTPPPKAATPSTRGLRCVCASAGTIWLTPPEFFRSLLTALGIVLLVSLVGGAQRPDHNLCAPYLGKLRRSRSGALALFLWPE